MSADPLAGARYVRLVWCDNANQIRAKAFHSSQVAAHRETGIGISTAQQAVTALVDAPAPDAGLGPVGEVWLRPDWDTATGLPYAPGHVRVMADLVDRDGPWACCPRTFLRRTTAALAEHGLSVRAAFEHEFTLLRRTSDGGLEPMDRALFATTSAMDGAVAVINDITDALVGQGLRVLRYYPESGPGQHEISIEHGAALQAADQAVMLRETVRAVAAQHGLLASFLPKVAAGSAGNGCHLHLSAWRDGEDVLPAADGALSDIGRQFLAGILDHLPALMAVTVPSPNSYRRLQPHTWSGAFQTWGYDNREAAIRVPTEPAGPTPTHLEVKTVDAAANPYLALGAVLAAGMDGVERGADAPEPVQVDPGTVPNSPRLPSDLGTALAALERDDVLRAAMGPALVRAFLAVRREEARLLAGASLDDEVRQLIDRY
jgi:glutamine synthetase